MTYTATELDRIHRLARQRAQALRREAADAFWSGLWTRFKSLFSRGTCHTPANAHPFGA